METDYEDIYRTLTRRYGTIQPEALIKVLCPLHVPIDSLDKRIFKVPGQPHYRATFTAKMTQENAVALVPGCTGKFIPGSHLSGAPWREIAKGRILNLDVENHTAIGEVYVGSRKADLEEAVASLTTDDVLEIDQFGASAKVLSALTESSLETLLSDSGYTVQRMPEDTARHIGGYFNYDFDVWRGDECRKVEVKSLWGTNTRYARLIHSKSKDYETSSCKFATQDIFAVSLFLRTGNITDFAFAKSEPKTATNPHGLPRASKYPNYVNQNPLCEIGNGTWFASLDEVW